MRKVLCVLLLLAACGDDPPPPPPKAGAPAQPGAAGAAGAPGAAAKPGDKNKLGPRVHVEDRIARCPVPEKPDGPECKADAPTCDPGRYCLPISGKFFCEPCPERDSIRHAFRDRDFVENQARDPFQSYVIIQKGLVPVDQPGPSEPHKSCTRDDQFVAGNYSFSDLKLVGIVAQGTQRKVLMMDSANFGHIIKRGDCVGKEKAVVKDIGTGYLTFQVDADPSSKRPPEERSVQLHELPTNMTEQHGGADMPEPSPSTVAPPVAPKAPPAAPKAPPSGN